jgi:hypothetical protein
MSNKITTLVLNLFIAESRAHRERICNRIVEIIDSQFYNCGLIEREIKQLMIQKMEQYLAAPSSHTKDVLYAVVQFHAEFYNDGMAETMLAAA